MKVQRFFSTLIVAAVALCMGARAADQPLAPEKDAKTKALEERVKVLEKRIAELEGQKGETAAPRRSRQREAFAEMLQRMQREMMDQGDFDPRNFFGDEFALPMAPAQAKPRLGVMLENVNDELKTRFKNDVKDGAFVMSIVPDSAAQKAGLAVGDAVTAFDGKAIATREALTDAVKSATTGTHEITVLRHGEALLLKAELGNQQVAAEEHDWLGNAPGLPGGGNGWLRNPPGGGNTTARTEIKVSSLELTDSLARDLKLSDDQRKKMDEVLSKHSKALSQEFTQNFAPKNNNRGVFGFSMSGDLNALAKKHADDAAKDLAGILNAEQLKKWNEHRSMNSSVSFSQVIEQRGGGNVNPPQREEKGFSF